MGVRGWQFSTEEQTILNASLLARSRYFQEWRKAVQKVLRRQPISKPGARRAPKLEATGSFC